MMAPNVGIHLQVAAIGALEGDADGRAVGDVQQGADQRHRIEHDLGSAGRAGTAGRSSAVAPAPAARGAGSGALGDPALHRGQRFVEPCRIGATGHRKVGLAAALAADLLGNEIDELAGLDPADASAVTPAAS